MVVLEMNPNHTYLIEFPTHHNAQLGNYEIPDKPGWDKEVQHPNIMMALKADWVPFTYRSMNGTEAAKKETYTVALWKFQKWTVFSHFSWWRKKKHKTEKSNLSSTLAQELKETVGDRIWKQADWFNMNKV
jgi:hypothetical protein